MHCLCRTDLRHFSRLTLFPSPISNLLKESLKNKNESFQECNDTGRRMGKLPVEERLCALAIKPNIVVKMQIMSIAVSGINLAKRSSIRRSASCFLNSKSLNYMNLLLQASVEELIFEHSHPLINLSQAEQVREHHYCSKPQLMKHTHTKNLPLQLSS